MVAGRGLSPRVRGNQSQGQGRVAGAGSIPACAGEPAALIAGPGPFRVYPRVCGGTATAVAVRQPLAGLSPRVRGNRATVPGSAGRVGSIPACAGEPRQPFPHRGRRKVYPRVCGGTAHKAWRSDTIGGLSPRVRGNRGRSLAASAYVGSIPACAGEPLVYVLGVALLVVYPRVCGGTRQSRAGQVPDRGLSPRVRGNPFSGLANLAIARSIPACAGEPAKYPARPPRRGVYPRVCGGTHFPGLQTWLLRGLSPRVRGNPPRRRHYDGSQGSIPACAGEPPGVSRTRTTWTGLSPRVRGNPHGGGNAGGHSRSIPACAGEPRRQRRTAPGYRVYPRVCGGTPKSGPPAAQCAGLSPRVRGNPPTRICPPQRAGSIPACAGEPLVYVLGVALLVVYPRVCGGTAAEDVISGGDVGLSPRVRGNPETGPLPEPP